jgi:hypothetical protein
MVATANTGGAASRFDRSNPAHHDMGRPERPRDTCPGSSMTDTGNGWRRRISTRRARATMCPEAWSAAAVAAT